MPYGQLATTGVGLGALALGQLWLVFAAVALVLIGALLVRASFRRGKSPHDA